MNTFGDLFDAVAILLLVIGLRIYAPNIAPRWLAALVIAVSAIRVVVSAIIWAGELLP